jgi:hypothetical protein
MPLQLYKIASNDLTASTASVTFSNIPQGYTDLKVVCSVRAATGAVQYVNLSFNGSTASFTSRGLEGDGATAYSYTSTFLGGVFAASTYTANTFANNEIYIPNYTSSNYKSYSVDSVTENNATTSFANMLAGLWSNTAAINSITIVLATGASIVLGSTFTLYGIL